MADQKASESWRKKLRNPAIWAMGTLFLVYMASYADRAVLSVLQEEIKADLHLSDTQLGLLAGPVFALLYGVMGIPLARLAERSNRKRIIIFGVMAWSSFTALCGLATNFIQLAILRMGVGAAEAAAPPAAQSLVADYFTRKARGRAMSILALGVPVGLMVGGAGGGIVAEWTNWRIAFMAIGLPGVLIGLLALKTVFEKPRTSDEKGTDMSPIGFWAATKILLSNRVFVILLLAAILVGNAAHAVSAFVASYFIRAHELDLATAGGVLLVGKGLAGMAGTVAGGFLSDRFDRGVGQDYIMVPAVGCLIGALLYGTSLYVPSVGSAMIVFMIGAFFGSWVVGPTMAAVQNVVHARTRATGAALFMFCITVPGSIGPVMVGIVSDIVASGSLGLSTAEYAAMCPGGKLAEGVTALTLVDCQQASILGLRMGMTVGLSLYVGCFAFFVWAVIVGRQVGQRAADEAAANPFPEDQEVAGELKGSAP